jgi:hypothetical protein
VQLLPRRGKGWALRLGPLVLRNNGKNCSPEVGFCVLSESPTYGTHEVMAVTTQERRESVTMARQALVAIGRCVSRERGTSGYL